MRIRIVGGGPAGLYFALLMKRRDPAREVVIHERDGPDDTFGWGIVFSGRTVATLESVDPDSAREIARACRTWDEVHVVHRGRREAIRGNRFAGIGRLAFLRILRRRCADLGVEIRYHANVGEADVAGLGPFDLLVGADGANSVVRRAHADRFRPSVDVRRNRYVWLGTPRLFHGLTLTFREHGGGLYVAHSYEFDATTSTFIVECDPETWAHAGLERLSEAETCAHLARVFADDLAGAPLLANGFLRWLEFPIVRNASWRAGNVVLLGDALHTAHFSIGSGTKLAIEDAIALAAAFDAHGSVDAALDAFARARKPVVDGYQEFAHASLAFFETARERLRLDPLPFAYEVMTRSGKVDRENLLRRDPEFVARYDAWAAARGDR